MNVDIFWDIAPCSPYVNRRSKTAWHYIPEDDNIYDYRCENLKSYSEIIYVEYSLILSFMLYGVDL
jgi:hypothetical protein